MKIDHLFQFDIPEGVNRITFRGKTYSREDFNKLKNKHQKIKDKKVLLNS